MHDSTFDFLEMCKICAILITLFGPQAIFYMRRFGAITLDENSQNSPAHLMLYLILDFFEIQIWFRLVEITLFAEIILQVEIQKAQIWRIKPIGYLITMVVRPWIALQCRQMDNYWFLELKMEPYACTGRKFFIDI